MPGIIRNLFRGSMPHTLCTTGYILLRPRVPSTHIEICGDTVLACNRPDSGVNTNSIWLSHNQPGAVDSYSFTYQWHRHICLHRCCLFQKCLAWGVHSNIRTDDNRHNATGERSSFFIHIRRDRHFGAEYFEAAGSDSGRLLLWE